MRHFSPLDLKQHLETVAEMPLLLDVREPWEFQYCHIEHSKLVPMGQIMDVIETLDPARETILICHHGIRSRQVAYYLEQQDFSQIINLEGGVEQWAQQIEPTMKRY